MTRRPKRPRLKRPRPQSRRHREEDATKKVEQRQRREKKKNDGAENGREMVMILSKG